MANDIIEEIKRLQEIERQHEATLDKLEELATFIRDWDNDFIDRLPASHEAKINYVRSVYNFCKRRDTD
jgi:hypothetical protein